MTWVFNCVTDHPLSGWLGFSRLWRKNPKERQCLKRCKRHGGAVDSYIRIISCKAPDLKSPNPVP